MNELLFEYDKSGRLKYNPALHPNHKKPYTISELEYICKYYEIDGRKSVSSIVGRTESTIASLVHRLKKDGMFDYYKDLKKNW